MESYSYEGVKFGPQIPGQEQGLNWRGSGGCRTANTNVLRVCTQSPTSLSISTIAQFGGSANERNDVQRTAIIFVGMTLKC